MFFLVKALFTLFFFIHLSCIKTKESELKTTNTQSVRYQGTLPFGDTVTLDSPMTPLAEAIRSYALAELVQLNQGVPVALKPDRGSLPRAVKDAILATLGRQAEPLMRSRSCEIDPNLITPAEIVYSLQRAILGKIETNHQLNQIAWATALGYKSSLTDVILNVESWYKDLEIEGLHKLPPKVKDSLGIQLVNKVNPELWKKLARDNLGENFDIVLGQNVNYRENLRRIREISSDSQSRCFINGQFHYISKEHLPEQISHLDPYQNVTFLNLDNQKADNQQLLDYINSKKTITGMSLVNLFPHLINSMGRCTVESPFADKISREVREKIKRIRLDWASFSVKESMMVSIRECKDKDFCAKPFINMFKEKFPNATEFDIVVSTIAHSTSKPDLPRYFMQVANFIKLIAKSGAKTIRISSQYSELDRLILAPLEIENLDSLIIKGIRHSEVSLPKLLAVTQNVRKLSIMGMRFTGTQEDMAKLSRSNVSEIYISQCWGQHMLSPPIKFKLDQSKFPKLEKMTVSKDCQKVIQVETVLQMLDVLRKLTPNEMIDVVSSNLGDRESVATQ